MSQYKLIQDIEAEDHILGPLTLRQFIFALIAAFFYYLCFIGIAKHVPFILIFFLPLAIFFSFFAFPFGKDQPTEIWALAKLRFLFKSRKRVWSQSGVKELVTITVPKKIDIALTDGLSENEVKSRLGALANTLDTRGWAVKGLSVYDTPSIASGPSSSERLLQIGYGPQEVPSYDMQASDDMLDESNNRVAQNLNSMINISEQEHRQSIIDQMNATSMASANQTISQPATATDSLWFMNSSPSKPTPAAVPAVPAGPLSQPQIIALDKSYKTQISAPVQQQDLKPITNPVAPDINTQIPLPAVSAAPAPTAAPAKTDKSEAAILSLASNNDLNVATIARQASKNDGNGELNDQEVVISLH